VEIAAALLYGSRCYEERQFRNKNHYINIRKNCNKNHELEEIIFFLPMEFKATVLLPEPSSNSQPEAIEHRPIGSHGSDGDNGGDEGQVGDLTAGEVGGNQANADCDDVADGEDGHEAQQGLENALGVAATHW